MNETYGSLLKTGTRILQEAGVPDARIDAEQLLLEATGKTRSFLFIHKDGPCDPECAARYLQHLQRRCRREPLQYIIGSQEFMGLPFRVSPSVLIPRQDTEILVERAIQEAKEMDSGQQILDMCCGSGAIAVSCAYYLPQAEVTACDISEDALSIAGENAEQNGVADRMTFLKSDLFTCFREWPQPPVFDLVLSNPPYIPAAIIPTLQPEVAAHEPGIALDGGEDGLDFYRILAEEAWQYMRPGALLLLEIGSDQAGAVSSLLKQDGHYGETEVIRDLAGLDRVICTRRR